MHDKDNEVKILDYSNELELKVCGKTNFLECSIKIEPLRDLLNTKYGMDINKISEIKKDIENELKEIKEKYCLEYEEMLDIFKNLFYSKLLDYKKEMEKIYKKHNINNYD